MLLARTVPAAEAAGAGGAVSRSSGGRDHTTTTPAWGSLKEQWSSGAVDDAA